MRGSDLPSESNQELCPSSSVQASRTDDSEGPEIRENMITPMRLARPGQGGFIADAAVTFGGHAQGQNNHVSKGPPSLHAISMYTWRHLPPPSSRRGSLGDNPYGKTTAQYRDPVPDAFNKSEAPQSYYHGYQGHSNCKGPPYNADFQGR
jgi:hypothetical protein